MSDEAIVKASAGSVSTPDAWGPGLPALWRRLMDKRAVKAARKRAALCRSRLAAEASAHLNAFLGSGARLGWPTGKDTIDITVIVVIWNQPHFVLKCLRALAAQTGPSIEVVLVDNGSAAPTQDLLARLDDFTILRNPDNEGFIRACNRAARSARGRTLLFLNSDAFVWNGALANALAVLDAGTDVGAVGGRVVLPSGRLQEAGCVIRTDGTTSGRARGLAPDAPLAMRRDDVDYCSGAFLLTPRAVWERLGGFDEAFAPGYYEDADYCMRLREAGLRVVFEPTVVIDHVENGSEVRDGEASRISERNRAVFVTRYAGVLAARDGDTASRPHRVI